MDSPIRTASTMKSLPSRSPSRRCSPPPPPRLSRRSPGFSRRGRSPDRRRRGEQSGSGGRMSPPRNRERREFRRRSRSPIHESSQPPDFPIFRRSRSPIRESKRRSFSPKPKTPSKRERREADRERPSRTMNRKRTRSKSPSVTAGSTMREGPRLGSYNSPPKGPLPGRSYQGPNEPTGADHGRMTSLGERFPGSGRGSYEDDHGDRPVFRGPEGSGYDLKELKKITVDIHLPVKKTRIERTVINPDELLVVRQDGPSYDISTLKKMTIEIPGLPLSKPRNVERTVFNPEDVVVVRRPGEGSRPIFAREEIMQGNERSRLEQEPSPFDHRPVPTDDHQRVVAIPSQTQSSGGPRLESPGRYIPSQSSTPYVSGEREHGSHQRDYGHPREYERNRGSSSGFDSREKNRDDNFERRDDLRHDLEMRRRDDSRYSSYGDALRYDKGRDYREGDRHDREPGRHHPVDRHEVERNHDRRPMMPPSPSSGDRRRGNGGFGQMDDSDRKVRDNRLPGPSNRRNDHPDAFFQDGKMRPRPGSYQKSWDLNPEYVPKGRSYFEHDNRDEIRIPIRGRGIMGPRGYIRGRGMMRGRPFRGPGPPRGFMGGRATGRRGGFSQRGFYNMY